MKAFTCILLTLLLVGVCKAAVGDIKGEYVFPSDNDKWLKVNYISDKDGFRIVSQKETNESEWKQSIGGSAGDHQAKILMRPLNGYDV